MAAKKQKAYRHRVSFWIDADTTNEAAVANGVARLVLDAIKLAPSNGVVFSEVGGFETKAEPDDE